MDLPTRSFLIILLISTLPCPLSSAWDEPPTELTVEVLRSSNADLTIPVLTLTGPQKIPVETLPMSDGLQNRVLLDGKMNQPGWRIVIFDREHLRSTEQDQSFTWKAQEEPLIVETEQGQLELVKWILEIEYGGETPLQLIALGSPPS